MGHKVTLRYQGAEPARRAGVKDGDNDFGKIRDMKLIKTIPRILAHASSVTELIEG